MRIFAPKVPPLNPLLHLHTCYVLMLCCICCCQLTFDKLPRTETKQPICVDGEGCVPTSASIRLCYQCGKSCAQFPLVACDYCPAGTVRYSHPHISPNHTFPPQKQAFPEQIASGVEMTGSHIHPSLFLLFLIKCQ